MKFFPLIIVISSIHGLMETRKILGKWLLYLDIGEKWDNLTKAESAKIKSDISKNLNNIFKKLKNNIQKHVDEKFNKFLTSSVFQKPHKFVMKLLNHLEKFKKEYMDAYFKQNGFEYNNTTVSIISIEVTPKRKSEDNDASKTPTSMLYR